MSGLTKAERIAARQQVQVRDDFIPRHLCEHFYKTGAMKSVASPRHTGAQIAEADNEAASVRTALEQNLSL